MPNALEQAIERALAPGRFVSHGQCWDFVGGLDKVQARIAKRIEAGHPEQAVELYETFIASCYAKSEEVDGLGRARTGAAAQLPLGEHGKGL